MIKYNWDKIMRTTEGDPASVLTIIHILTYNRLPYSKNDPTYKYYGKDFVGDSFLVNPKELLREAKKYGYMNASLYIMVASYRNYLYYKKTGRTSLELIHLPFVQEIINKNRLLRMEDGVIHFKFEDNAKEKQNGNKI